MGRKINKSAPSTGPHHFTRNMTKRTEEFLKEALRNGKQSNSAAFAPKAEPPMSKSGISASQQNLSTAVEVTDVPSTATLIQPAKNPQGILYRANSSGATSPDRTISSWASPSSSIGRHIQSSTETTEEPQIGILSSETKYAVATKGKMAAKSYPSPRTDIETDIEAEAEDDDVLAAASVLMRIAKGGFHPKAEQTNHRGMGRGNRWSEETIEMPQIENLPSKTNGKMAANPHRSSASANETNIEDEDEDDYILDPASLLFHIAKGGYEKIF